MELLDAHFSSSNLFVLFRNVLWLISDLYHIPLQYSCHLLHSIIVLRISVDVHQLERILITIEQLSLWLPSANPRPRQTEALIVPIYQLIFFGS